MRRVGIIFMSLVIVVLVIAGAGLLVFTRTDFGRERVRRMAVSTLQGQVHGIVRIGKVSGNLLDGIMLHDVSITDSTGAPLIVAERIGAKYRVLDFAKKRIDLWDVELVRPLIVLDRQPGEKWNYQRLFPGDTTTKVDTGPGWGDWLSFRNVTIVEGRMVVRTPWEPSDDLAPEQRVAATEDALAGGTRSHVIRAANGAGLQKEMEFRDLNAKMPRVRLADPDEATRLIEVATLQTIAALFNPPDAEIRDLKGTFELTGDSAWWSGLSAKLPASQINGSGRYAYESGDMRLRLVGAPITTADLRWLFPQLPADGEGKLEFAMDWIGDTAVYVARNADLRIERAQLAGNFGITLADSVTFHDTDLRFSNLGTRLIQQIAPAAKMPVHGTLAGRTALAGGLNALDVDADVTFDEEKSGRSRVVADGEIGVQSAFRAKQLKLQLSPVQVDLVHAVAKTDFPIGGTVRGTVTVDGSSKGWLASAADLTHEQGTERSHILGKGEMRLGQARWMNIDVRATPVSLVTVGRFIPAAELQGQAVGPITVTGPFSSLDVSADLAVTGGGALAVRGNVDIASDDIGYNLAAVADLFNANVVIARLPRTSLTAKATARGQGFDPATMRADLSADVATSEYDSLAIDSAKVRVSIANGVAHVDTLVLRAPSSRADVQGTFGLTGAHEGRLVYTVGIDSLGAFSRWLPARDTGTVEPRPGIAAKAIAQVRADSARHAEATAVEVAVTGKSSTAPPVMAVDTPTVVAKDSLAGSIYAAGTLEGSVARFDARGRAGVEGLVYGGNQLRHGRIEYGFVNGGTDRPAIAAGFHFDSLLVAGFALDSVDGRIAHQGENGNVTVVINQAEKQQYSLAADFTLHADHREVHLNQLALQFDTTYWKSAQEGTIRWGGRGIQVETLDLRNGPTGRIYVNGTLPSEGSANLDVEIDNFEIGNLVSLLQSDLDMRGLVSLTADIQGTTKAPRFEGALGIENGRFRGTELPSLHGVFDYADQKLTANATASQPGGPALITAQGTMPINLGGGGGPRLPDAPMSVDVAIDRFPLAYIPPVTDALRDLRGTAVGRIAARGTVRDPKLVGALEIAGGQVRIAPLGVTIANMAAALRMAGDSIVIDSLVGSSGGRIFVNGGIGLASLTEPSFDLELTARNAQLLDNDKGNARVDADLAMRGPFKGVYINGQATVLNAVYYVPKSDNKKVIGAGDPALFSVVDTAVVDSRTLFPGQSPLLANMRMDVAIAVNRDTWVRSQEANIEVYSDGDLTLQVDRAKEALALEGIVTTERGQYTFLGRRFDVRRGSATFIGGESGLNPTLQITAEHQVQLPASEAINIQVVLGGTLEAPTIALTSDAQPPLTQSDLLSYVAFGRTSSSLLQLGGSSAGAQGAGGGMRNVGTFASQQLFGIALGVFVDELEGEAARSLGADVLNITPADVYSEVTRGQFTRVLQSTELEVGRYFGTDTFGSVQTRLSVQTPPGLRLSRRFWTDYRVEASFEPRLALRTPSLSEREDLPAFSVLGLFLIREWKF